MYTYINCHPRSNQISLQQIAGSDWLNFKDGATQISIYISSEAATKIAQTLRPILEPVHD